MSDLSKWDGLFVAVTTPFDDDGGFDPAAFGAHIEHLLTNGARGIVACGTTGEAATMTAEEKRRVIGRAVEVVGGRAPVVAGVGTNSTEATLRFAEDALDVGADALLVVTPYYNKPPQRGLIAHYRAIARATQAPIIVYNVPGRTSVDIRPETIAELAELPEIVAVKDATGSLRVAGKILALCGDKLALLSGDDFTALALVAVGGRGCISVVGNVDPRRTSQMIDAALRGDLDRARGLDRELLPLTELLFQDTNPIPVKAAVAMLGFGSQRVRSPLAEVEPGLAGRLRERLRVLELID